MDLLHKAHNELVEVYNKNVAVYNEILDQLNIKTEVLCMVVNAFAQGNAVLKVKDGTVDWAVYRDEMLAKLAEVEAKEKSLELITPSKKEDTADVVFGG